MAFLMKVQGLNRLQRLFNKLPKQVQEDLNDELENTSAEVRDGAKREAPKDVARLQNSISAKKTGVLQYTVVAQTTYAAYLEFGTRTKVKIPYGLERIAAEFKGPAPGQGDPIKALAGWLSRTGRNYQPKKSKHKRNIKPESLIDAAWALFKYIMKVGINPQPFFFKQVEPARKKIRGRIANVIKKYL